MIKRPAIGIRTPAAIWPALDLLGEDFDVSELPLTAELVPCKGDDVTRAGDDVILLEVTAAEVTGDDVNGDEVIGEEVNGDVVSGEVVSGDDVIG